MAHSADNLAAYFANLRISEILALNTHGCIKLTALTDKLRKSSGVKLNELKMTDLNFFTRDMKKFLQDIATEQQFDVTYFDITDNPHTGNFQCFVRMNTDPVVECYGNGTSPEEAEAIAAQTALEYLQTVTKK